MATTQKRPNKNKTFSYRVMIRQSDGFPPAYKTFPTKEEAKHWGKQEEARHRQGCYFPAQQKAKHTLAELIDRYLPTKPKDARNARRQLEWWKARLGKYALQTISSDLIAQYRQELAEGCTSNFMVKLSSKKIIIVETKGLEDLDVPFKMERLRQWCDDINLAQNEVTYDFVYVDQESFEKYSPSSFQQLLNGFREYKYALHFN
jgi:hypothetical protein